MSVLLPQFSIYRDRSVSFGRAGNPRPRIHFCYRHVAMASCFRWQWNFNAWKWFRGIR